MRTIDNIAEYRAWRKGISLAVGERVGFFPTMGALHEGHLVCPRPAPAACGQKARRFLFAALGSVATILPEAHCADVFLSQSAGMFVTGSGSGGAEGVQSGGREHLCEPCPVCSSRGPRHLPAHRRARLEVRRFCGHVLLRAAYSVL